MPKCDFNKVNLLCNFIEITLRHACSPVNLLRIFRTPLSENTSGWLLLFQIIGEHNAFMRFVKVPRYFQLIFFSEIYFHSPQLNGSITVLS